jgi:hypothetical protein
MYFKAYVDALKKPEATQDPSKVDPLVLREKTRTVTRSMPAAVPKLAVKSHESRIEPEDIAPLTKTENDDN